MQFNHKKLVCDLIHANKMLVEPKALKAMINAALEDLEEDFYQFELISELVDEADRYSGKLTYPQLTKTCDEMYVEIVKLNEL